MLYCLGSVVHFLFHTADTPDVFDFVVINSDVEEAYGQLKEFIVKVSLHKIFTSVIFFLFRSC